MRLLRVGPAGLERPCIQLSDGTVRDVGDRIPDFGADFFENDGLEELRSIGARSTLPELRSGVESGRIGPPVMRPGKIVCIGLNYRQHVVESGAEMPTEPVVFMKSPSTVSGPDDDVLIPPGSLQTDWEIELGVIIGRTARYLRDQQGANEVIAGYVISNDVSERHYQLERGGQWVKGKSFDTFNPLGPVLVTADEIEDVSKLEMELKVNGEIRQRASVEDMIFPIDYVVWYLSQFMTLEPGDLINTGTPAGVGLGMSPPEYIRPGDVMELRIDSLGTQRQVCRSIA